MDQAASVETTPGPEDAHARDRRIERAAERGAYWSGSRLFVALSAMLFGGGVFTYFYLHSLDSNTLWRLSGQRPSDFISVPVLGLAVGAGLLAWLYTRWLLRGQRVNPADWRVATGVASGMFLLAGLIQLWGMTRTGFAAGSSGYASTYTAIMPVFAVYCLGAAYWLETGLARSLRARHVMLDEVGEMQQQDRVAFRGSASGAGVFSLFVALVAVATFIMFSVLH